ncbi:MAG TPA: hypothetical protein VMT35_03965 [Ignavibacteriaceae bacterium]|nr:hypothetical protein [Ignavibacteriaceae bacterium]
MDRYLIETTHTKEDCLHVLDLILAHGFITHYDWGCDDGVHTGWAIVEADSRSEALLSVPPLIRNKARAVKIRKFSPEIIQSFHKQMKE